MVWRFGSTTPRSSRARCLSSFSISCSWRLPRMLRWDLRPPIARSAANGPGALRELLLTVTRNLRPVAFIDDDPTKAGEIVSGVPVAGSVRDLEVVIRRFEAGAVVVTSEKISEARLARIGAVCDRTGVTLLK